MTYLDEILIRNLRGEIWCGVACMIIGLCIIGVSICEVYQAYSQLSNLK